MQDEFSLVGDFARPFKHLYILESETTLKDDNDVFHILIDDKTVGLAIRGDGNTETYEDRYTRLNFFHVDPTSNGFRHVYLPFDLLTQNRECTVQVKVFYESLQEEQVIGTDQLYAFLGPRRDVNRSVVLVHTILEKVLPIVIQVVNSPERNVVTVSNSVNAKHACFLTKDIKILSELGEYYLVRVPSTLRYKLLAVLLIRRDSGIGDEVSENINYKTITIAFKDRPRFFTYPPEYLAYLTFLDILRLAETSEAGPEMIDVRIVLGLTCVDCVYEVAIAY